MVLYHMWRFVFFPYIKWWFIDLAYKIIKSAIHVTRLTIHEVGVRNPNVFSDKLVENWRWQIR